MVLKRDLSFSWMLYNDDDLDTDEERFSVWGLQRTEQFRAEA